MTKEFKVMYTVWYENEFDDLFQKEFLYAKESTLEEAVATAKALVDEYTEADGYKKPFSLSDRHFGTYREDIANKFADGIRAWVE